MTAPVVVRLVLGALCLLAALVMSAYVYRPVQNQIDLHIDTAPQSPPEQSPPTPKSETGVLLSELLSQESDAGDA